MHHCLEEELIRTNVGGILPCLKEMSLFALTSQSRLTVFPTIYLQVLYSSLHPNTRFLRFRHPYFKQFYFHFPFQTR